MKASSCTEVELKPKCAEYFIWNCLVIVPYKENIHMCVFFFFFVKGGGEVEERVGLSIYSGTSVARTLMARLPRLFRTRSLLVPRKNPLIADLG